MRFIFLFLTICVANFITAQSITNCDSLISSSKQLYRQFSKIDSEIIGKKIDSLQTMVDSTCLEAEMYINIVAGRAIKKQGQLELAMAYYDEALAIGFQLNKTVQVKDIYNLIAAVYSSQIKYALAYDSLQIAIAIPCHPDSVSCHKQNLKILINGSTYLRYLDRFQDAIAGYKEARSIMQENNMGDSIYRVAIANSMGTIYEAELSDDSLAMMSFKEALRFCPYGHSARFSVQNNIGNTYKRLQQEDDAINYFNKTINNCKTPRYLVTSYAGLGDIACDKGDYTEAIVAYKMAVVNGKKSGIERLYNNALSLLGKAYYLSGDYTKAQSTLTKALQYYENHDTSIPTTDLHEIKRYHFLASGTLMDKFYGEKLARHLEISDSLMSVSRTTVLDNSMTRFRQRITLDSLRITQLTLDKTKLKSRNQKLGLTILLASLLALISLLKKYKQRITQQNSRIDELVFQQNEITLLNQSLKERILSQDKLETIPDKTNSTQVEVPVLNRRYFIDYNDITHLKAENNGCRIIKIDETVWTELPVKQVMKLLPDNLFVQIFRGIAVNIDHIKWVNHASLMLNSEIELKIGRTYKDDILKKINR